MLLVTCFMPISQGVMLGPFNFFVIRLVILAGLIRIFIRREYRELPRSPVDRLMVMWSIWALAASMFHVDPAATLTFNGGIVFNTMGAYIMLRVFCNTLEEVVSLCRLVAWLLVPVALLMVYEKLAVRNLFSVLGGVSEVPDIREGRIRAQGPFAHAILGGTVGAVMLPVCLGLWNLHRGTAVIGAVASMTIVLASASSGPLLSAILATLGLLLWPMRGRMRMLRWSAVALYLVLMLVMEAAPYYLMARIDLSGGSTGWHRSRLIESSLEHLGEWWFAGTDYTRHWMASGVGWSPNHVDLTNHYLLLGVQGGLPLMLLFILVLAKGFSIVGQSVQKAERLGTKHVFFYWALGASLFAHAATSISVSYFDQSFVFLYITLAAIAGLGVAAEQKRLHPPQDTSPNRQRFVTRRLHRSREAIVRQ
jgi:hypothetical protein